MSTTPNGILKPLQLSCTSTDCTNNLHCFQLSRRLLRLGPAGRCRDCGVQLIDWARVHRRDATDVTYTFEALRYELIRHHFWHIPLSDYAINYARRKGALALKPAARKQVENAVGSPIHPAQGRQTPRETNPKATAIHYAQHATACCCRKCLEEWHGIPAGRHLTTDEIDYLTNLVMLYVSARTPDLSDESVHIPKRRPPSTSSQGLQPQTELQHAS